METNLELSKNLKLTYITENNWRDGKLIAVQCYFTFFGEHGEAFIVIDKLDGEFPSYAMTEICSELSDSFNDLLEDDDNWEKIVNEVKKYVKQWELKNMSSNGS